MSGGKISATKDFKPIPPTSTQADKRRGSLIHKINSLPGAVAMVALLACAALIFLFWAKSFQPTPLVAIKQTSPAADYASPQPAPTEPGSEPLSPWNESQLAALRKNSQAILATMLEAQEQLRNKAVEKWASEDYALALSHARRGDQRYQNKQFEAAISGYQQAQEIFGKLLAEADEIVQTSLTQGRRHLQNIDAAEATESFEKALLIEPDNTEAGVGLQRARTLDQVTDILEQATTLLQQGKLQQAGAMFKQAMNLDKYNELAKRGLEEVRTGSRDRDFSRAMSAGYAALENNDYTQATAKFNKALQIKPGAGEATSALKQSRQEMITANLSELLLNGGKLEIEERWNDAADVYTEALKLDNYSADARQKQRTAKNRAMLDRKLTLTIAHPERLGDQDVYREALALREQIDTIPVLGPRITGQKATLAGLLRQAREPITVGFISDNKTDVQIYKVGKLGNFDKTSLELLPGKYIAVGNRPGYRDVRVEFIVQADRDPQTVMIQCREPIGQAQ